MWCVIWTKHVVRGKTSLHGRSMVPPPGSESDSSLALPGIRLSRGQPSMPVHPPIHRWFMNHLHGHSLHATVRHAVCVYLICCWVDVRLSLSVKVVTCLYPGEVSIWSANMHLDTNIQRKSRQWLFCNTTEDCCICALGKTLSFFERIAPHLYT